MREGNTLFQQVGGGNSSVSEGNTLSQLLGGGNLSVREGNTLSQQLGGGDSNVRGGYIGLQDWIAPFRWLRKFFNY